MKTKSNPNIKRATLEAFRFLPDQFRGNDLFRLVKIITGRRFIHTDSALRKMRVLRKEGKLNYKSIGSKDESLYQKV